jgi:hypothetical protein
MLDTLTWDIWLGIGSSLLLVAGLIAAAVHRTGKRDVDPYPSPRRHGPMPLYEEGGTS